MADNYLENKMEEHRRTMSAPKRRTGNTITQKGLAEAIGWNSPCILIRIDGSDMRLLAPIAGTLRQASCRVAFICTDANLLSAPVPCTFLSTTWPGPTPYSKAEE